MPNNYFTFKQFIVHQDLAAMKVGTDGVLLGAWAPVEGIKTALDIGTGTGLIALMLAQRSANANIDAIEIDDSAYQQADFNFKNSPWSNRLNPVLSSLQLFNASHKYDLIVSNPPYFVNSLKNNCDKKSKARHTDSLSFNDLIKGANNLLAPDGKLCVILPTNEKENFEQLAQECDLYLNQILNIKPTPTKPSKRVLLQFSHTQTDINQHTIIREEFGRHQYSEDYKQLTKDFYLKI